MDAFAPVQGLKWDLNAISTAEWKGVLLKDLLKQCGIDFKDARIKHIQFEGLDKDPTGATYGASVPKEKVFSDEGDVLIAYQMNNVDLPADFGFPLRVVVPGVVGARSVKWLHRVVLSEVESKSFWQLNDYKMIPPSIKDLKQVDFSKLKAIQESPVQSAICEPANGAVINSEEEDTFTIRGYAFSGGGKEINSVVLSIDGGKTWKNAAVKQIDRPMNKSWSWAIWEYELDIPEDKASIEIMCVATDSANNTQPDSQSVIWNARGLLNNSWHKIHINFK